MLFPTHLLVGYVLGRRWGLPTVWVVAGAALPDVVDKPLAMVGVADLYQTVGHSLLALGVAGVVIAVGRNTVGAVLGRAGAALWVGWASHLVLDAIHMVVNGRPGDVRFLAWPFVHHVPAVDLPPVAFLFQYLWTPSFFLEVAVWVAAAVGLLHRRDVVTGTE